MQWNARPKELKVIMAPVYGGRSLRHLVTLSTGRTQREINAGAQLTFSFSSNLSDRVGTLTPTLSSKSFTNKLRDLSAILMYTHHHRSV